MSNKIISIIQGGLGNQMFQYAYGECLSKQLERPHELYFTQAVAGKKRSFELDMFSVPNKKVSQSEIMEVGYYTSNLGRVLTRMLLSLGIKNSVIYEGINEPDIEAIINAQKTLVIEGYWQSAAIVERCDELIRSRFKFPVIEDSLNKKLALLMKKTNSVSIHVRRGDFVASARTRAVHEQTNENYFNSAVRKIISSVAFPEFFIFSDDMDWVRRCVEIPIKYPTYYLEHNIGGESYRDMQLMTLAKHSVISNSSFSWWGAWLGAKKQIVIAPKNWTNKIESTKVVPNSWELI